MPFHILNTSLIELIEKWDNVICCSSDGVNSCAGLKYELVGDSYLTGGELNAYTEMLTESRQIAIGRMVEEAESMGANAIVALRLQSAAVMQGAAEMVAYGTAVVIE